jgi:hypothetical protein
MQDEGLRRLATAVIVSAINDYQYAGDKLRDRATLAHHPNPKVHERILYAMKRECSDFLANNSIWHQILGLNPESVIKRLRRGRIDDRLTV